MLILDVHNQARRKIRADGFRREYVIGSSQVPTAAFASFWRELAARFAGNQRVIFGIMNEPYDMPAKTWLAIAQSTIKG